MNEPDHRHQGDCGDAERAGQCDLSVVIPVYRSEATLEMLFQRLVPTLDGLRRSYEIVLVEDGSPDGSWAVLESLQRRHSRYAVAIQLLRNSGQHNALMCGFRYVRGRFVVTMDDDLQHPPEEIPRLLEAIESSDFDLVYGKYADKQHNVFRNLGSQAVNRLYQSVFRMGVTVTSFRVIRRPLLDAVLGSRQSFLFLDGLLAWNTQRVGSVLVAHHPRKLGQSTYSFGKLVALAVNLFTSYTLVPLRLISLIGVLTVLAGMALGAYGISLSLAGVSTFGSLPVITVALFLGGLQLLAMGTVGEYLGRMHMNMSGKPQYHERQVLGGVTTNIKEAACNE